MGTRGFRVQCPYNGTLRLHIQLIRAVLYGSGNGWYFEADPMGLLGSPGPPYEMRVYVSGAPRRRRRTHTAGVLASAAHSVESLVPGSTLEAKADWLRKHKTPSRRRRRTGDQEAERRSIDKAAADAAVAAAREAIFERLDALPALLVYARDERQQKNTTSQPRSNPPKPRMHS